MSEQRDCCHCYGEGEMECASCTGEGSLGNRGICLDCGGTGRKACARCSGSGVAADAFDTSDSITDIMRSFYFRPEYTRGR
ncbi:hypothetical protein EDM21_19765 [Paenibacillus sp. N10]|uniref:Uncharacterized protein n=2 Tax=Paenibacillus lutrae TaxID=2078573 RepID=A0A7X3K145_9BACL|nr:hypothetical protein [Paenibacillus lutrae]